MAYKLCPNCGLQNIPERVSCKRCGEPFVDANAAVKTSRICPNCGLQNIPERETCKSCGASLAGVLLPTDLHYRSSAITGLPTLIPASNSKYIFTPQVAPLFNPGNRQQLLYATLPKQPYAVVQTVGNHYEIVVGGGQTALVLTQMCKDVPSIGDNLAALIPAVTVPAEGNYSRQVLDPMPLAQIPYDSDDYRLMYQWLGDYALQQPTIVGIVRNCTQKGAQTFSISEGSTVSKTRTEGFTPTTRGTFVSSTQGSVVNYYQLLVEDRSGARRVVEINRRVNYVPQVDDHLVIWGPVQNNICFLEQGIQRDRTDPSLGVVLTPRMQEQLGGGGCNKTITIYSLLLIVCMSTVHLVRRALYRAYAKHFVDYLE